MTIQNTDSAVQEACARHLPTLGVPIPHLDATKALHHALPRPNGTYTLQVGGHHLVVDPSKKGQPGDIVVVWPRKKGPMVARRLARCAPYNTFHFRALDTGDVFELPCNKVSAVHAVDGDDLEAFPDWDAPWMVTVAADFERLAREWAS